jgi:signal transduction histidine kinase
MNAAFKYVVTGIIAGLVLVFIWQLYWLKGLYDSIEEETVKNVISCMAIAEQDELWYRMDNLDKHPKEGGSIEISQSISNNKQDSVPNKLVKRQVINENDTTIATQEAGNEFDTAFFDKLVVQMKLTIHQSLDTIIPVNLNVLDSLIRNQLENKAITAQVYYLEIIDLETDSVIQTSRPDSLFHAQTQSFIYEYAPDRAYKLYMEPLSKTVLMRMSGILVTTLLIIILLGFAFRYLIRTVFRQKTLEEMKDDFTNNMTHELKTPIAVAYSATDALLNFDKADNKAVRERYLLICKEQLLSLTGLVEQILSMNTQRNKTLNLNMEDIPAKDLVMNLVELHTLKAAKNVSITMDVPDDLLVRADRNHLHNILSNLIDNAIKYSGEKPEIEIRMYRKEDAVWIEVKDNGIGISPENQKHIFDRFYRVPHGNLHNVKGYGLGLHYVKVLMEKHGGSVSVKSSIGKGSVFTLQLKG